MNLNDALLMVNVVLAIVDIYLYKVYVMDVKKNVEKDEEFGMILDDIYT